MKIKTSFAVLMQKAAALGEAKKTGNKEAIAKAQEDHDAYLEIIRQSDEMTI